MEELMKALEELFTSTNVEVEDDCFQSGELVDRVEGLCCEELITSNGGCNWANIKILRENGYDVFAGDKDSFGWLTGCVQRKGDNRILVYG